jgi:hypothetical protein
MKGYKPKTKYTEEIVCFLRENAEGKTNKELCEMTNSHFGLAFTKQQIRSAKSINGITGAPRGNNNALPLLSETTHHGQTKIKISNNGKQSDKWRSKQIWVWEQANGKIPKGHCLISLDNNPLNTNIENLMLVHMAVNLYLNTNGMKYNDPECTRTAVAIAKLQHETHKKLRNKFGYNGYKNYKYRMSKEQKTK